MKDYKNLNVARSRNEFMASLEGTLHYVVDIIVDFHNETYKERSDECFRKFVGQPAYSRPGL